LLIEQLCCRALGNSSIEECSKEFEMDTHKIHPVPNVRAIHNTAIVIDTHADTAGRFVDESFDPEKDAGKGHWDFAKARACNLGAEFFAICVDPVRYKGHFTRRALDMIDSVHEIAQNHPNDLVMAYSVRDILLARSGPHKRIAALIGIEGGHAIEGSIRVLRNFYRLGARYMTLTWMNSNELGQSSGDLKLDQDGKPDDRGLSDFGREVVREMNRLGMMVDVSHVSDRSFFDAVTLSHAPVIASHSGSRAITNHPRNLTDDMLIALARNGGVAQVNFNCGFISDEFIAKSKAFEEAHPAESKRAIKLWHGPKTPRSRAELKKLMAMKEAEVPRPPLSALIDHFEHMIEVAGVNHVGIGSDFDGVECLPQGIDGVQDLPKITAALAWRGYSTADLYQILGRNVLRVFGAVEQISRHIQSGQDPDRRPEVAGS